MAGVALDFADPEFGFDGGEAVEEPGVADDGGEEGVFLGGGGLESVEESDSRVWNWSGSSPGMRGSWAKRPCWRALRRVTDLPAEVRGPVDLRALRRLASICLMVAMCEWSRFQRSTGDWGVRRVGGVSG